MNTRTNASTQSSTRLFLDHGVDEAACERFRIEERGVTFDSPWEFPVMAELSICVDFRHPRLGRCRAPVKGVVVGSQRRAGGAYETTVLFCGPADEHMTGGREVMPIAG
jgi:hypothetical protein